jgi:predicted transcriptional regulator
MRTPCEAVVQYMLPAFRSYLAKVLINEYHLSQVVVAKRLGTTQAAISHYISSKRGNKKMDQFESIPLMKEIVREVARKIDSGKIAPVDILPYFCKMCKSLRTHNVICNLHKNIVVLPNECDVCPQL